MTEEAVDVEDGINPLEAIPDESVGSNWIFCNSVTLLRSEVLFFTQAGLIYIIVITCLLKLALDKPQCEDMTFWVSLLSGSVGLALPNPKL